MPGLVAGWFGYVGLKYPHYENKYCVNEFVLVDYDIQKGGNYARYGRLIQWVDCKVSMIHKKIKDNDDFMSFVLMIYEWI